MKMDVDRAITTLVDAMLPKFSPQDKGLLLELNASYFYDHDEELKTCSKRVWMFFHRPSNYTKVFYLTKDSLIVDGSKLDFSPILWEKYGRLFADEWQLEAYHDSCWEGGVNRIVNNVENEIVNNSPLSYPIDYNYTFISFGSTNPQVKTVEVKSLPTNKNARGCDREKYSILFKEES